MSATKDVEYQWSKIRPHKDESDEQLARRLFAVQMEVYSANAGRDLVDDSLNFDALDEKTKQQWLESARKHRLGSQR